MNEREAGGRDPGDPPVFDVETAKGFISALLDLSFTSFVTPGIIQFVYVICLAFAGLWILFLIAGAFSVGAGLGLLMLVVSPLLYLTCVLFIRLYLELAVVLFRIYETLSERPL